MAAVAHGDEPDESIDDEIDEHNAAKHRVRNDVAVEPVEYGADHGAERDDRDADLRIEVLADVKISARADGTSIDGVIGSEILGHVERNGRAAAAALDCRRAIRGGDRQTGPAFCALHQN